MSYDRWIATLSLVADLGILVILIIEFQYDKLVYENEEYKKRNARKKRFMLPEEKLTTGEMQ